MNILRKIKDRKKVPGTTCCPVCDDRFMFYSHHHDCIDVIQQMFYRFTKASEQDIAKEICRYELHKPNTEYSREITEMNIKCTHKLIIKYGGSEKEWELVKAEVKKILKSLASDSQVEKAIKDIKARLKGFTYKQKENIMYRAINN